MGSRNQDKINQGKLVNGEWLSLRRDVLDTPKGFYQFAGFTEGGEVILSFDKRDYFMPVGGLYYCSRVLKPSASALARARHLQRFRAQKKCSDHFEQELASLKALDYSKLIL